MGDCTTQAPARGCEVLEYDYAASTTATATALGDVVDHVSSAKVWSWNPDTSQQSAVVVARYAYDAQGRLREVWDPRLTNPIKTVYDYDDAGRVIKVTPAGQLPWMFDYGATPGDDNAGRLLKVRRAALKAGTKDQLDGEVATNVVYNVPLTKGAGGPHNMDYVAITTWGQKDLPTDATAVFGPETDPGANSATATTPGSGGYTYATTHYLNAAGQEVNTATPGGHIDSHQFDQYGNEVWTLEATNRELALGLLPDAATKAADLNLPADSAARAQLLASINTYSPDGLDLIDEWGPVVKVALERQLTDATKPTLSPGTQVVARAHTVHRYKATSTTTDAGTAYVVYDDAGRTLQSWGIGSTGSDARATITVYYTAGTNSTDASCGNKPEWAGQPCITKAGGPITGQRTDMTSELPVKRVEEYTRFGEASKVAETSAGKTRRTVTSYDGADRVTSVQITSDEGVALPATTTDYDPTTGLVTATRAGQATITRTYDQLGRVLTYTDADGGVTRNEFDKYGKPTKVSDNTGTATFTYDRTAEPRGMLTSVTDSIAGTFNAKYSPDFSSWS